MVVDTRHVRDVYGVTHMIAELNGFLSEGVLTQNFVLNNIQTLVSCLRNCNVTLRWLLLHRFAANRKLRDLVLMMGETHGVNEDTLFTLFLDTSRLEFELKQVYGDLLGGKEKRWQQCSRRAADCMKELSDYFAGSQVLSFKVKDESLQRWFLHMASQVGSWDYKEAAKTGRNVQHMVSALHEVEQFHQIDGSLQIKQHLFETRGHLQDMLLSLSVQESMLATIAVVSDAAYALGLIGAFTNQIHTRIRSDTSTVLKLQCLFLKLRSIMDIPILRISQCGSDDIFSVSEYYSSELVAYVRIVLDIIPVSIFNILKDVVASETHQLHDLPGRVEKEKLRDFAQLEDRYMLSKATHQVSVLSQGIMAMTKTFIGAIELDPRQLLEEGIRKQLVKELASKLHSIFVFSAGQVGELEEQLHEAQVFLRSQQRLMEYFQDYVHVHGLRVWQEEFTRIVNYTVEQECNNYIKRKVQDWESPYQSSAIPIPQFSVSRKNHSKAVTFMGCIVEQLLALTDPSRSMYLAPMSGWFDASGEELVGLRTFIALKESLGAAGMMGIDRVFSFDAASSLQQCLQTLQNQMDSTFTQRLEVLDSVLTPVSAIPDGGLSVYKEILAQKQLGMKNMAWESWVETIAHIGQLQLLRCLIASHLHSAAKVDSGLISCAMEGMNKAVLSEILKCTMNETQEGEKHAERLLNDLSKDLHICGFNHPLQTVYITSTAPEYFALVVFVITISQLSRYVLDNHLGTLASRMKKAALDFCPLIVGLVTLFHQFHPTLMAKYLQYLGQYVRAHIKNIPVLNDLSKKSPESRNEVNKMLTWLLVLLRFHEIPIDVADSSFPLTLLSTIAS